MKEAMTHLFSKEERLKKLCAQLKGCTQCGLHNSRINAICGEGNVNARFFFIAQAPGETEDVAGSMFLGPTGKVVDELLAEIDLERTEVYMTNLIKCRLPNNRKPKTAEKNSCGTYLLQEIEIIKPEFLIPLGYHATKFILIRYGCENMLSSDFIGKLIYCSTQKIYPLRHPSAALYNPLIKQTMSRDFRKISVFEKPCKWYPLCPMKDYFEKGWLNKKWVELYCKGDWTSCKRYQLEENGRFHPDYMLPDGSLMNGLK